MPKIPLRIKSKNERSCDGCTKCCEGWLHTEVLGHKMYPGSPCPKVINDVGCGIYETRPDDPCKAFACLWKADKNIPEHFKPSEINAIIARQEIDGIPFLSVAECGQELDQEFLSWFVTFGVGNGINIRWKAKDMFYAIGHPDFLRKIDMSSRSN